MPDCPRLYSVSMVLDTYSVYANVTRKTLRLIITEIEAKCSLRQIIEKHPLSIQIKETVFSFFRSVSLFSLLLLFFILFLVSHVVPPFFLRLSFQLNNSAVKTRGRGQKQDCTRRKGKDNCEYYLPWHLLFAIPKKTEKPSCFCPLPREMQRC